MTRSIPDLPPLPQTSGQPPGTSGHLRATSGQPPGTSGHLRATSGQPPGTSGHLQAGPCTPAFGQFCGKCGKNEGNTHFLHRTGKTAFFLVICNYVGSNEISNVCLGSCSCRATARPPTVPDPKKIQTHPIEAQIHTRLGNNMPNKQTGTSLETNHFFGHETHITQANSKISRDSFLQQLGGRLVLLLGAVLVGFAHLGSALYVQFAFD